MYKYFKKVILVILISTISICLVTNKIFSKTSYVPSDDEIAPVSTITTGNTALSNINIRIFQPFMSEMDDTTSDDIELPSGLISDAQCPVAPVKTLQKNFGTLIKTIRTYDSPISFADIQSLGSNQIIIFSGHGTYMGDEIHSTIITGKLFDEDQYYNDPLYRQDVDEERIVSDVGSEAITYKYIEKYCPNINNSFVFLGICEGAYDKSLDGSLDIDETLVNAFLNKGAKAVFAYSQTTNMRYSNVFVYSIINDLANKKTLGDALNNAKSKYGEHDPSPVESIPLIFPSATAASFSIDSIFNTSAPVSSNYVFDGKEKTGVISGVGYSLSGDIKKVDAGNYVAYATLNDGFVWPDGTTETKTIYWSIEKFNPTEEDLMPNNIEIKYNSSLHDLMTIRNKDLGTYFFRLKGESEYKTTIPKAKDVGTYEIEWYFDGGDNVIDIGSSTSPISYITSIVKGTRPNMEARLSDYYYGESLPSPYLTEDIEEGTNVEYYYFKLGDLYNTYKWENMTSTSLDIGTYYIFAKIEETDNYKAFETYDSSFEVLKYIPNKEYKVPNTKVNIDEDC